MIQPFLDCKINEIWKLSKREGRVVRGGGSGGVILPLPCNERINTVCLRC